MIVGDIIYELTNKGAIHHGVLTLVFRGPLCTIRGRDGEFPARCSEGAAGTTRAPLTPMQRENTKYCSGGEIENRRRRCRVHHYLRVFRLLDCSVVHTHK